MIEKDLGQIIPDITATATIDNTEGVPSVSVTVDELNELNRLVRKFNFAFLHLKGEKGDKPVKGIDYLTEEEKQQFTTETLGLVTAEGNKQIEAVGNKGTEQAGKVTSEGSKQITLVSGEANKVITQLKELIAGNPDTSNAQALSGKSRIEFERDTQALAGKYAGNFPLTSAVKDAVYLVPATGKFYVCTQAYNGSNLTAPNANFEEMSVWANRDKLSNLFKYVLVEEKISKRLDHQIDIGFNGHAIFESVNYQNLPNGFYRIVSKRFPHEDLMNYVDFQFENKKITKSFNLTFWSYQQGEIKVDLDKQAIAISAHSGAFHDSLKVRLYRVE